MRLDERRRRAIVENGSYLLDLHIALGFDGAAPAYEPGDSLELYPENDPALVDHVLAAAGLSGDDALRRALLSERDISTLSPTTIERYVQATGHADAKALLTRAKPAPGSRVATSSTYWKPSRPRSPRNI